ncbi:hypothetical protein [Prosthecomicrobium pneumaticum]|uniref:Uncharacterized protein n=1 Tax=Prosthecomicrobium pneumaticum TaxID=81895 RepID=A0A7W9FR53_9HYPH|nr:hypothetical protein [Prosthecomicrobium pneumaticum]MBB5755308.1 hypothetical protein [Prosthecomicrobium pneumaticum]
MPRDAFTVRASIRAMLRSVSRRLFATARSNWLKRASSETVSF